MIKIQDCLPPRYAMLTPGDLLWSSIKLTAYRLQETIRETWQEAHRATYDVCPHPSGALSVHIFHGIKCSQCGLVCGEEAVADALKLRNCPTRSELEEMIADGSYRSIPAEYWREGYWD